MLDSFPIKDVIIQGIDSEQGLDHFLESFDTPSCDAIPSDFLEEVRYCSVLVQRGSTLQSHLGVLKDTYITSLWLCFGEDSLGFKALSVLNPPPPLPNIQNLWLSLHSLKGDWNLDVIFPFRQLSPRFWASFSGVTRLVIEVQVQTLSQVSVCPLSALFSPTSSYFTVRHHAFDRPSSSCYHSSSPPYLALGV